MHDDEPAAATCPASQAVQELAPVPENVPTPQSEQTYPVAELEYCPAGQFAHPVFPAFGSFPAAHVVHIEPVVLYSSLGHATQPVRALLLSVPALHPVQLELPATEMLPAAQELHVVVPPAE